MRRMTRRDKHPDDEFFAPVLREPPPRAEGSAGETCEAGETCRVPAGEARVISDTGVPGVHGAGRGDWARSPLPPSKLGVRLLALALALLAGVVLTVLALIAERPLLAVVPAVVALAAAFWLVAFGVRRTRSNGGPPTFG
ncbi:hypothetical protein SAMN05421874_11057 [Nonomuraea maritima]|uniref:Uncharacterized protein n=2 Tax=Nonomuraea maritima TaxID=683260 RepID=A0A1G9DYH3_9ACTN|nr:hypothetical protein SAMN05421874_11057 [Nonomuraea maritima]